MEWETSRKEDERRVQRRRVGSLTWRVLLDPIELESARDFVCQRAWCLYQSFWGFTARKKSI